MEPSESPALPPGVGIRLMREADIPAGVGLCRASRWNQTAGEWTLFLEIAPGSAFVAARAGTVVGTAVRVPYRPSVEWVAMVLVDPAERGRGIGRALLLHVIASVPSGHVARLDATPAGRALYATLGFEDECGLARYRGAAPAAISAPATVTPLGVDEWPEVCALDRRVFGADRARVLEWCWRAAPEYAWVSRGGGGALDGFMLGRHGHDTEHIGPVVAPSDAVACDLVAACLARARRPAVSLDVPGARHTLAAWLRDAGFFVERPFTRMRRGPPHEAGLPGQVYASAGPELG